MTGGAGEALVAREERSFERRPQSSTIPPGADRLGRRDRQGDLRAARQAGSHLLGRGSLGELANLAQQIVGKRHPGERRR